jgi:hypothetical protein
MAFTSYQCAAFIKDGKLVLDDTYAFKTAMCRAKDGTRLTVTVEREKDRRSVEANRYYWGVVIKLIAQETGQPAQDIHDDLRDRFLRKTITYTDANGLIREREFARGSSGLTVAEFYEFVEQARLFAAEFFGLRIPDPDPEYWRQREKAMEAA